MSLVFVIVSHSDQRNSKEKGLMLAHGLEVPSIMARKAWQQEPEAAGRRASAVKRQRKGNSALRSFSPLSQPSSPSHCRFPFF